MTVFEENPPWIDAAITRGWPRFEASNVARPLATLKGQRRRVVELGCGHYGCVLPTDRADVVIKITSDPSEAALVAFFLAKNIKLDGVVRYYEIAHVEGERRGRSIYAIWRESAYDVGTALAMRGAASEGWQTHDEREVRQFIARLHAYKRYSHEVKAIVDRATHRWALLEASQTPRAADIARDLVETDGDSVVLPRHVVTDRAVRIATYLRACELEAEFCANEPQGYFVGQALSELQDDGMLLADVHMQNIGRVDRPDHQGAIVITDPGHTVFLKRELADQAAALLGAA